MGYVGQERRKQERTAIDSYDKGYFLEADFGGKQYRFNPLNTSTGGMGMLVSDQEAEFLRRVHPGDRIKMKYSTPDSNVIMNFELRYINRIKVGPFRGHYQVGLAL
jgi:hypothetical protein